MHWPGGSSRLHVPAGYLLPAVTTRGAARRRLVRRPDGRARLRRARARAGAPASSWPSAGKLTPLTFRGTRRVRRARAARIGDLPDAARLRHGCRPATTCSRTTAALADAEPGRHQGRVLGRGRGEARRLDDAGAAAHAHDRPSDGSWAYTLYNSREYPFIHALPLGQGAWAACIELPKAWRERVGTLRLRARDESHARGAGADGRVVATADLHSMKLALANPRAAFLSSHHRADASSRCP